MEASAARRQPRLAAALREGETVSPLELFFDLVFVLAITQCTALTIEHPTWEGVAQGLLVLGVLWWTWVGYSWLTSVVDPEDDAARLTTRPLNLRRTRGRFSYEPHRAPKQSREWVLGLWTQVPSACPGNLALFTLPSSWEGLSRKVAEVSAAFRA